MSIHLLVVGEHYPNDAQISSVWRNAVETGTFKKLQCKSPNEVVKKVRGAALSSQVIDTLDFFDHATPGCVRMGNDILFMHDGTGRLIARALRPLLTTHARVRLLGCETAQGSEGQQLLSMLSEEFGDSVVVYGTIAPTESDDHFDSDGFKRSAEEFLLFSAAEAAKQLAPDFPTRLHERLSWYAVNGS